MKGKTMLKRIASAVLSAVLAVTMIGAVTASAAGTQKLSINQTISINNNTNEEKQFVYKLSLPDSGYLKFLISSSKANRTSGIKITDSANRSIKTASLQNLAGTSIRIPRKGVYYATVILARTVKVDELKYVFTADSAKTYEKNIGIEKNARIDGTKLLGDMGESISWSSSNNAVVRVKDGVIFGVAPGTAKIRAYGANGAFGAINVTVKNSTSSSSSSSGTSDSGTNYSLNTILIGVKSGTTTAQVKTLLKKYKLSVLYDYKNFDMYALKLDHTYTKSELNTLLKNLENESIVTYAERDYTLTLD